MPAAAIRATGYHIFRSPRLPKRRHSSTNTKFPSMIMGMICHSGPIPNSLAKSGETIATVAPELSPQVITLTIKIRLTAEPVTNWFPRPAVAACTTTKSATKIAVRVIQRRVFLFLSMGIPPIMCLLFCTKYTILPTGGMLHVQRKFVGSAFGCYDARTVVPGDDGKTDEVAFAVYRTDGKEI
ncbi:hypothetical protein SDC9_168260 [bioreactor metagenome]|uniref:Uncharacterized protein n=1 Tax=bioreactor metagenome TaxID=1076179 RepID=A0A645G228_9ZZZZ